MNPLHAASALGSAAKACRRAALALLLAAGATASPAVERFHGSTLRWVYPLGNGDFVIGFNDESSYCTSTNSPKYMYISVGANGVNAEGSKKMYAAAMVALATNKVVNIAYDDATVYCYINRLTVSN